MRFHVVEKGDFDSNGWGKAIVSGSETISGLKIELRTVFCARGSLCNPGAVAPIANPVPSQRTLRVTDLSSGATANDQITRYEMFYSWNRLPVSVQLQNEAQVVRGKPGIAD